MASFDKARIDALLHDLRSWDRSDPPASVATLARRHRLDPMIVRRIAESEDVDLIDADAIPESLDDKADTGPIDVD